MCPFHFDIALPSGEAYRAVAGAASGRDAETALLRAASAFEANEIAEFTATLPKRNMAGKSPIQMTVFMGKMKILMCKNGRHQWNTMELKIWAE